MSMKSMSVKPLSSHCVPRSALLKPKNCVRPYYDLAYCVPFKLNNYFWRYHLHEEDKTYCLWHAQAHSFLKMLTLLCFLDNWQFFDAFKGVWGSLALWLPQLGSVATKTRHPRPEIGPFKLFSIWYLWIPGQNTEIHREQLFSTI